jgi:SpoVK/Ycf46/Vps4 family AAA+-type ATPase
MERRIVAQLITTLDDLTLERTGGLPVLVIGATNRPGLVRNVHFATLGALLLPHRRCSICYVFQMLLTLRFAVLGDLTEKSA